MWGVYLAFGWGVGRSRYVLLGGIPFGIDQGAGAGPGLYGAGSVRAGYGICVRLHVVLVQILLWSLGLSCWYVLQGCNGCGGSRVE